jgi:rhodanese-related sulfurtransferase
MKKTFFFLTLISFLFLTACNNDSKTEIITVITPQEVYDAVYKTDEVQLVDVRTKKEFNDGHLSKAQNVCVTDNDFKQKAAKLNKEKPVYVYCKGGGRSARAAAILKEMGFKEIYDMQGGLVNWESQGLQQNN